MSRGGTEEQRFAGRASPELGYEQFVAGEIGNQEIGNQEQTYTQFAKMYAPTWNKAKELESTIL